MDDYRDTVEGKRSFENKGIYKLTFNFQQKMAKLGVAWHNHFSNECTDDFNCCCGNGDYQHYIPSFRTAIKQAFKEYYEEIKHIDKDGLLKTHLDKFINNNY
jgi:hypothetical protein